MLLKANTAKRALTPMFLQTLFPGVCSGFAVHFSKALCAWGLVLPASLADFFLLSSSPQYPSFSGMQKYFTSSAVAMLG